MYFPGRFEDGEIKQYYDEIKSHTILKLKKIIYGDDVADAMQEIETRLALLAKPRIFFGAKSEEISYDKQFEEMCLILSHNINVDPYKMNVLQYFNAFEYLKKQAKRNKAK